MSGRGKPVAIAAATIAAGVIAAAAYTLRDIARERWHIYKLRKGTVEERYRAAETLAEMRSTRAVEHLIEAIRADPNEEIHRNPMNYLPPTPECPQVGLAIATPFAFALHRIGEGAHPLIRKRLESESDVRLKEIFTIVADPRARLICPIRRLKSPAGGSSR